MKVEVVFFFFMRATVKHRDDVPGLIDRLEDHTMTSSSRGSNDWVIRVIFWTHLKLKSIKYI